MADLHFELVTPEKLVFSEDVHMVVVPGAEVGTVLRDGGGLDGDRRPHAHRGAHRLGLVFRIALGWALLTLDLEFAQQLQRRSVLSLVELVGILEAKRTAGRVAVDER